MPRGVYIRTKENCENISRGHMGRHLSQEHKLSISKGELGKVVSKEIGQKISKSLTGGHLSKNHRQSISRGNQNRFAKMTIEQRREHMIPCIKAGLKATYVRWAKTTKEQRREYMLPMLRASQEANPSSIEKMIWEELDKLDIEYEIQFSFGRFIVDIYISKQGLIIECNGDFWHDYKIFPEKKIRDNALKEYATKNNYKIVWLWEHDIRKNARLVLLTELQKIRKE